MDYVHMETDYVAGLAGRSGDPSPVTAHGVFRAIQASAKERWGSDDLDGQDGRDPGLRPRRLLPREGAARSGREADRHRHRRRAREARRERVRRAGRRRTDEIYGVKADIFAPCALGGDHQRQDDSAAQGRDRRRRARTTSCSRSVTATSSRSAASSTRRTTSRTPAA